MNYLKLFPVLVFSVAERSCLQRINCRAWETNNWRKEDCQPSKITLPFAKFLISADILSMLNKMPEFHDGKHSSRNRLGSYTSKYVAVHKAGQWVKDTLFFF